MIQRVREGSTLLGAAGTMNELAPQGHLRPLGGRENPRRARPESRSPRRCGHAWGAPYSPRAAPGILTKGEPTGTRAQALSRSCTCAKALTETHPSVRMADVLEITLNLDSFWALPPDSIVLHPRIDSQAKQAQTDQAAVSTVPATILLCTKQLSSLS